MIVASAATRQAESAKDERQVSLSQPGSGRGPNDIHASRVVVAGDDTLQPGRIETPCRALEASRDRDSRVPRWVPGHGDWCPNRQMTHPPNHEELVTYEDAVRHLTSGIWHLARRDLLNALRLVERAGAGQGPVSEYPPRERRGWLEPTVVRKDSR